MEGNSYGIPKSSSKICSNDDEATNVMDSLKHFSSKLIVDDVLLYWHTAKQLLEYFRTVLGVLKQHQDTLKLKSGNGFRTGASL